jgi:large subunit ribosomal protein L35
VPKMKTHKASKKRFKVSAKGKLKRAMAGKRHLNSHKTSTRKRGLTGTIASTSAIAVKYVLNMGGK